jgi:RHS repeat-associated protein
MNGKEVVSITDRSGKVLMTARPGNDLAVNNSVQLNPLPYSMFVGGCGPWPYNYGSVSQITGASLTNVKITRSSSGVQTVVYEGPISGLTNFNNSGGTGGDWVRVEASDPVQVIYTGCIQETWCTGCTLTTALANSPVHYFKIFNDNATVNISGNYSLFDMSTEQSTSLIGGNTLNKGYYKLIANSGAVSLSYSNSYTDISYNFYNQLGQLVATIAPEGVKKLIQNINGYPTRPDVPFMNTWEYDVQGRMIAITETDGGRTEYIYCKDGEPRFSQNENQRINGWFSYTNYDQFGRIIEAGEYHPTGDITFTALKTNYTIIEDVTNTGGLPITSNKYNWIKTKYDAEDNSHGLSGYTQTFLRNAISTTENTDSKTWYSYDEQGRVKWVIKWINGLGYKTTDYEYDPEGNLTKMIYQKNVSVETFVHYYEYDAGQRLQNIYTNTTDNPSTKILQQRYIYTLDGATKRVEVGGNLQGLDYTFTLDGKLKAINHSDVTQDPGNDGNNGFLQDAFGEVLEYYNNDYVRSGTNIGSININSSDAPEQYGIQIRGMSWFSKKPTSSGVSANPTMYVFKYDEKYDYTDATWGSISANSFVPQAGVNKETINGYDMNGNILNLIRSDGSGTTTNNFLYNYLQTPKITNKLASITQQTTGQNYANYQYDGLGQLTAELPGPAYGSSVNKYLQYDVAGKINGVYNNSNFSAPTVQFVYDENGRRIKKLSYESGGPLLSTTYYVYGTSELMSIYEQPNGGSLSLKEVPIYAGGERIASYFRTSNVYRYELKDHLGNVRTVFIKNVSNTIDAVVFRDYYPFGMPIPGREYTDADGYRYGYQGQFSEKDPETNWNSFEFRMYDSKIGRWLTPDEAKQFGNPYMAMGNDVINGIDPDGRLMIFVNGFRPGAYNRHLKKIVNSPLPPPYMHKLGDPEKIYTRGEVLEDESEPVEAYWGHDKYGNAGVDDEFGDAFGDHHFAYADGTNEPFSKAGQRFNEGVMAANALLADITLGKIKMKEGETIKIIGHSHGGAYAAGMATQLLQLNKLGLLKYKVEYIGLVAPQEPQSISVPAEIYSEQWQRKSDKLTSSGPLARLLGSRYARVGNILNFYELPRVTGKFGWEGMGGHYISYYHNLHPKGWWQLQCPKYY